MPAPEYLNKLATSIWNDTADAFAGLEDKDPTLLSAYCQSSAIVEEMQIRINQDGLVTLNSKGHPSAHPLLNTMKGYLKTRSDLYDKIRKGYDAKDVAQDSFA